MRHLNKGNCFCAGEMFEISALYKGAMKMTLRNQLLPIHRIQIKSTAVQQNTRDNGRRLLTHLNLPSLTPPTYSSALTDIPKQGVFDLSGFVGITAKTAVQFFQEQRTKMTLSQHPRCFVNSCSKWMCFKTDKDEQSVATSSLVGQVISRYGWNLFGLPPQPNTLRISEICLSFAKFSMSSFF